MKTSDSNDQNSKKTRRKRKFQVLFVCTGNSCRSAMAEGILKRILPLEHRDEVEVVSAGTAGLTGLPATDLAIEAAEEHEVDISEHESQGISLDMMKESDLVLVMTHNHEQFLRIHYPNQKDKVFLLKAFENPDQSNRKADIQDPIGRSKKFYNKTYREIGLELVRILPKILQLTDEYMNKSDKNDGKDEADSEADRE